MDLNYLVSDHLSHAQPIHDRVPCRAWYHWRSSQSQALSLRQSTVVASLSRSNKEELASWMDYMTVYGPSGY